ncbi:hypothetical protein [Mycobacterium deserti]|uniref:LSDAT prokaryote domain-containing protein n=1 Tax=Mycobacterium deserti TaxID=2978347 RepID=A0ABT2M7Y1_9MYCO|nr:hypothetical protein [Mycobacterium deserti]MCT7658046.1 hypothetical protein [Mycobacterium deserti]
MAVEISEVDDLRGAVTALGLQPPLPTVVVVGGAGGLDESDIEALRPIFVAGLAPAVQRHKAAVVDGGTLSGVMRLCGEIRASLPAPFPLVGVVAVGTVLLPGRPPPPDAAPLEPRHSHFVIVPGTTWGAEAPWIAQTASVLAASSSSATVLINGGEIAYDDVKRSVDAGRRVIVIEDSGRTADRLADAVHGEKSDRRGSALAASGLVTAVPLNDPAALAAALDAILGAPTTA